MLFGVVDVLTKNGRALHNFHGSNFFLSVRYLCGGAFRYILFGQPFRRQSNLGTLTGAFSRLPHGLVYEGRKRRGRRLR